MAAARARRAPPQCARAEPRPGPPRPPRGRSYALHREAPRLGERSSPSLFSRRALRAAGGRGREGRGGGGGSHVVVSLCASPSVLRWFGGGGGGEEGGGVGGREVGGERRRRRHRRRRGRTTGRERRRRCPTVGVPRLRQRGRSSPVSQPALAPSRPWAPRGGGPAPGLCVAASTGAGLGAGRGRAWAGVGCGLRPGPRSHNAGGGEPEGGVRRRGRGVQLAALPPPPRFLPAPCAPAGPAGAASPASSDRSRLLSSLNPWGPAVWKQHGGARETCALEVGEAERSGFMKNECMGGAVEGVGGEGRGRGVSEACQSVSRKTLPDGYGRERKQGLGFDRFRCLSKERGVFVRGTSLGTPKSVQLQSLRPQGRLESL